MDWKRSGRRFKVERENEGEESEKEKI